MMFSYVGDATGCIFVPVLEIKGVTSVFCLHSDDFSVSKLLKLGFDSNTLMILTTRRRRGSAPAAGSGLSLIQDLNGST